ncbi:hypothetical protein [Paucibacter sp. DJ2R-2]|uniref:hypothetical protein n=1 Tax=Paucibacter sp. DJ2R-2 TaxID=2893558 RepID=UPI0021E4486B|nr:hypothetical protein [Paucibacter sp. DJ2R-2]MCV2423012.1 hypothetical protein [Paucibacter sp. DJ4R-1]MCV2440908.1 hypothetical protein [Paucibacter sp. DJ2R-2]
MLTLFLLALSAVFAWLAADAWRLRGGSRLPSAQLLKLRGQTADHLSLEEQRKRQDYDERKLTGNTNAMFLVFAVLCIGFLAAALHQLIG